MARNNGGYDFMLPSLSAEYKLARRTILSGSISRTIGRPTPGDVAQARSVSCGEADDGSTGCTISQGNPKQAAPRDQSGPYVHARVPWRQGPDRGERLCQVDRRRHLRPDQLHHAGRYHLQGQPALNASGSRIYGIEARAENKGIRLAGQKFDLFANMTWMQGHMDARSDTGTRSIGHALPARISGQCGVTWHTPFLRSAFTARYNYRGKYLESVGASPWLDEGRAGYGTLDLSLTQKVTSFATLKYEIYNVLGAKPKWLIGERLQYATEVDNYGRSVFVHLIIR
jgi:outer membrane receptor protein involved in Fe transport